MRTRYLSSIKSRVMFGSFVSVAVIALFSFEISFEMRAERIDVQRIGSASQMVLYRVVPLNKLIADTREDVVQVQQYLSDISATRGQDGLADGFEKAEEHANEFRGNVTKAREITEAAGFSKVSEALATLVKQFESFYQIGKRMAHAYVEGGPSAGNAMMPEFDKQADAIGEDINSLAKAMSAVSTQERDALEMAVANIKVTDARIELVPCVVQFKGRLRPCPLPNAIYGMVEDSQTTT